MKTYPMTIREALKDQPKLLEKVEETIPPSWARNATTRQKIEITRLVRELNRLVAKAEEKRK